MFSYKTQKSRTSPPFLVADLTELLEGFGVHKTSHT